MKLVLVLGSVDLYTTDLRLVKSYTLDQHTAISDIWDYHRREVGRSRCALEIHVVDTETSTVSIAHKANIEPKKKIVINASKTVVPKEVKPLSLNEINDLFSASQLIGSDILTGTAT